MLLTKLLLLIFLQITYIKTADVTFKNVVFRGYSIFTPKFRPTILSGNNLKDYLPNKDFDTLEFIDQNIPVIYEDAIANIDNLSELILESSDVREIRPGALKNLPLLNRISLKVNKIERIEKGVFNNLPVRSLDLSYNQITNIYPQAFDDMQHIYYINLSYNNISKWDPQWFKNTPELSIIFMKNNLIKELPEYSFTNLNSPKIKIKNLNLIFSHNKISKINPLAFRDLTRINRLSLSNNLLEKFAKEILQNTIVNDLRLNNNSIQCFDEDGFDTIFGGQSVYIEFNPFDCECLKKMQKWTKDHNNKYLGINEIKCGDDDDDDQPSVIEIEDVVWDNTLPVNKITLIMPKKIKPLKLLKLNL